MPASGSSGRKKYDSSIWDPHLPRPLHGFGTKPIQPEVMFGHFPSQMSVLHFVLTGSSCARVVQESQAA